MNTRVWAIVLALALLLSACDALISQAVEGVSKAVQSNPPQIVITREVITTVEPVVITTTPIPTATITPVPSFMGLPIQPDPALSQAVNFSLAALGPDFEARLYTRAPGGEVVVWVRDNNHPQTLWCGAPLHYPGLGSLLVLTTSNLYATANRFNTFTAASGCIAVDLSRGREQVRKILEVYQGFYNAAVSAQKFSSLEGAKYYIEAFLSKNKGNAFPQELNLVFAALTGDDFKKTSIDLGCPGKICKSYYRYTFSGAPVVNENGKTKSVPLAYARYFEQNIGATRLFLLGSEGQKVMQSALAADAKAIPLTTSEVLSAWFYQEIWEQLVLSGSFTVGLSALFQNLNSEEEFTAVAAGLLNPFSGVSHQYDASINPSWKLVQDYLDGLSRQLSPAVTGTFVQLVKVHLKDTYLNFIVFEGK